MKTDILDLNGKITSSVDLPDIFSTPYRPDLIHRVSVILSTHDFQPQGRDPIAGERTSATSWGTGRGAARMARVKGSGNMRSNQAAGVAMVVGGRATHPPRSEKVVKKEVNRKERRLAIASAIAATSEIEIVSLRGHNIPNVKKLPIVVIDEIEKINKTSELIELFEAINLSDDISRVNKRRKKRSGKSRMRGRTVKNGRGPLIVISKDKGVSKAASNLPGVECVLAKNLTVTNLAPGSQAGRLVVWSKSSLESLPKSLQNVGNSIAN